MAAALTWVLPAGEFQRRMDDATGRELVVAGTYRATDPAPVSPLGALVAIPRGIVAAAEVVISILLVGGAFALIDQMGTLARGAGAIVRRFAGKGVWAIPPVVLMFALFGAMENMQEEIIALVPVLLVLGRGLGVDAVAVVAMSAGAAAIGAAFGPSNPYQAGIALKLAQLPLLEGGGVRLAMFVAGVVAWAGWTMWYATRHRVPPDEAGARAVPGLTGRDSLILALIVATFGLYVVGVITFGWGFNELSALFFLVAVVAGRLGGLGLSEAMAGFLKGMETMVGAGVLVGVARAISVVLADGKVIDTIVQALASPLMDQPPALAALLMIPIHAVIHVAVPSVSGQAALTMPVLIPASDLIGLARQATVMAYQTGAGLSELLIPTNGALMAILLAARVPYGQWAAFAVRGLALALAIGVAGTLFMTWRG
ncbi:MAG: YfcC family protein [Gemmatimonadetes bacterium]|nr:YfcC family protein [Gemmatimonadota bacterium]